MSLRICNDTLLKSIEYTDPKSVRVEFKLNQEAKKPTLQEFQNAVLVQNPPMDAKYMGQLVLKTSEEVGHCNDDQLGYVRFLHQVTGDFSLLGQLLIAPRHYIAAVWSKMSTDSVTISSQMVDNSRNIRGEFTGLFKNYLLADDPENILTAYNAAKWTYNMTTGVITYLVSADAGGDLPPAFQGGIGASKVLPEKILKDYLYLGPDNYTETAIKTDQRVSFSD